MTSRSATRRAVAAEWRRVFATRGWWLYPAGAAAVTGIALWGNTAEIGYLARNDRAELTALVLTSGQHYGQLLAMLYGALLVAADIGHRTIGPALLAVPDRRAYATAKLRVAALGGLGLGVVTLVLALPIGTAVLVEKGHDDMSLVPWAVLVDAAGFALWSVLGAALAFLVRSQAAMVAVVVGGYTVPYLVFACGTGSLGPALPLLAPSAGSSLLFEPTAGIDPVAATTLSLVGLVGYAIAAVRLGLARLSTLDVV